MGSSRHRCNCSDCVAGREVRELWQHGGMDWQENEEDLLPYRKSSRSNWKNRLTRACKKSKSGEACIFDAKKVVGTKRVYDDRLKKFTHNEEKVIPVCGRCGKHGPGEYTWSFL